MLYLMFLLSFLQNPNYGTLIGKNDNFFIFRSGPNFKIVSYNGEILDSIFVDSKKLPLVNLSDLKNNYRYFYEKENKLEVVSIPHGLVFKTINDTLRRVDVSFRHDMTNHSHVFQRNDTLFKFGGYGYWSGRNFFTYFDENSRQWEYYPVNEGILPPGLSGFIGIITENEDDYFVLQGNVVDPYNGKTSLINKDIWKFSFREKKWYNMGTSNLPFVSNYNIVKGGNCILKTENDYLFANFKNNAINNIKDINSSFVLDGINALIVNDTLYNLNRGVIISTPLSTNFINENSNLKGIYFNSNILFSGLYKATIVVVVIIISILIFLRYRQNKLPVVSTLGIRYKGISHYLSDKEKAIINEILNNEVVSSQRMYDLVENPDLSYPQNNKIKNDTIKKLNHKIGAIIGEENFIQSRKLKEDQRVLVYYAKSKTIFR